MKRNKPYFVVGGTLSRTVSSYVERNADNELIAALTSQEYCYILDTRQIGKSSLIVRAMDSLASENIDAAYVDLSTFGDDPTEKQWYGKLLCDLAHGVGVGMEAAIDAYLEGNPACSPSQIWHIVLRDIVIPGLKRPLVIFIDEIEAVRKLSFSIDGFFATIRSIYNYRAENSSAQLVTFCLAGVASPAELIRSPRTTPFNIGKRIMLTDFDLHESSQLSVGLRGTETERYEQIRRIWHWTNGHPYLTQRLCFAATSTENCRDAVDIDRICRGTFLTRDAQLEDANLQFVRRQLLEDVNADELLNTFGRVQRGKAVSASGVDPTISSLLLAGVVVANRAADLPILSVRNRIYREVFDRNWIGENLSGAELRRQRSAARRGFLKATGVWAVVSTAAIVAWFSLNRAGAESKLAIDATGKANLASKRATIAETSRETSDKEAREAKQKWTAAEQKYKGETAKTNRLKDLQRHLNKENASLKSQDSQAESRLKLASRRLAGVDQERVTQLNRMAAMSGPMASTLATHPGSGREQEALRFGLDGVDAFARAGRTPPSAVLQGLADATCGGIIRRWVFKHTRGVTDAAFNIDASRLLTADGSGTAYIWDLTSGGLLQRFVNPGEIASRRVINTVQWPEYQRYIVTASDDGHVRFWDTTRSELIHRTPVLDLRVLTETEVKGHHLTAAAISPDARTLVTTGPENSTLLWKISEPRPGYLTAALPVALQNKTKDPKGSYVWSVDITRDGKRVASGGSDQLVRVWDTRNLKLVSVMDKHRDVVKSVRFEYWADNMDGEVLSASKDGTIIRSDATSGELKHVYLSDSSRKLYADRADLDMLVAASGDNGKTSIWQFSNDETPLFELKDHVGKVWTCRFGSGWNRGKQARLATVGEDGTASVWECTIPIYANMNGPAWHARFNRDETLTLVRSDKMATLWNPFTGEHLHHFMGRELCTDAVSSHDGNSIAYADRNGDVWLWDHISARLPNFTKTPDARLALYHAGQANSVQFSSDDRHLLVSRGNGNVELWDLLQRRVVRIYRGHIGQVNSAAFSHTGDRIVTGSRDGTVGIWYASGEHPVRLLALPGRGQSVDGTNHSFPSTACFSPDDKYVLSADTNGQAYLWRADTGEMLCALSGHLGAVNDAEFSPDGALIATAGQDGTVKVWRFSDALKAREISPLYSIRTHVDAVNSVGFSHDGKWLVTASSDGTCRVYPATISGMTHRARELLATYPFREIRVPEFDQPTVRVGVSGLSVLTSAGN